MKTKQIIRKIIQLPTRIKNGVLLSLHGVDTGRGCQVIGRLSIVNMGELGFGERCTLDGRRSRIGFCQPIILTTQRNASIKIGDHVGMSNCTIYAAEYIEIGSETLIGGGVKIYDTDFHSIDWRIRNTAADKHNTSSSPVVIGKHCFIGAGSIILKGVTIGDNAIVAAGAIISKSIPPNEVWGGNPARKIKDV